MFFRVKTDVPAPKHGARPRGADGAAPSTETEPRFPPRYGFRFGPVLKLARLRGRGLGEAAYNAEGPGPEQKKDLRDGRGGRAKGNATAEGAAGRIQLAAGAGAAAFGRECLATWLLAREAALRCTTPDFVALSIAEA